MSVGFPRAWEISRAVPKSDHATLCSFAQTDGGLLCDCDVLMSHREVLCRRFFYGSGGSVIEQKKTKEMRKESKVIVAIAPCCGNAVFAAVNVPEVVGNVVKQEIAELVTEGFEIKHMDIDEILKIQFRCRCKS